MKKSGEKSPEYDDIEIGCNGWRSWERLGEEISDWEGVDSRYGYAVAHLDDKSECHTFFMINVSVLRKYGEEIFKRLERYQGVIKARWTSNCVYMGTYGHWRS